MRAAFVATEAIHVGETSLNGTDALAASLARSPELFPHSYDVGSDALSLIRLARRDYEEASFLDERILKPHTLARTLPFEQLAAAVEAGCLAERCNFIFHVGHVGSTLLSRFLGADEHVFVLREPLVLRTLAQMKINAETHVWSEAEFERRLSIFLKLWSRTFAPEQTSLIKATSFVSESAPQLLGRPSAPKAILLYVKPETYIATILAGANAREEAKQLLQWRLDRLHRRIGREVWKASSLGEGEALALAWAAEMSALMQAKATGGERIFMLDFDEFVQQPHAHLNAAFQFLGCDASPDRIDAILSGGLLTRYSKAPEHAYSPQLRREILDEARQVHRDEIRDGLARLDGAASQSHVISECLAMAKS